MKRRHYLVLPVFLCSAGSFCILVYVQMCPDYRCVNLQNLPTEKPTVRQARLHQVQAASNLSQCCPAGGELVYKTFCVFKYLRTSEEPDPSSALVTLSTQGTAEYLHHVITVCDRWQGPISVAVHFSGQEEFTEAVRAIDSLRACHSCILRWVDWHLFYEESHPPTAGGALDLPVDCASPAYKITRPPGWKRNGSYPINVGRNIARNATETPYVFASDIELYPSENILPRFEMMMRSRGTAAGSKREVFVLPVFEVYSNFEAPKTKEKLRYMYNRKQAISFHKYRCNICHRIPDAPKWVNFTYPSPTQSSTSGLQPLHIWATVQRNSRYKLNFWEPFFIGTVRDPEFDPRLSWEGKQNKMQVAYEMCLMGYDFHILDDAFLVHSPGVNIYSSAKDRFRAPFVTKNYRAMKTIKKELLMKHGIRNKC